MRWIVRLVFALTALLLGAFAWLGIPATAAGLVAKNVCSGVFVARRAQADVLAADVLPASPLLRLVHVSVAERQQLVRGRMLWSAERTAMRLPGLGCVLDPTPALLNGTADDPAARQAGAAPNDGPPQDAGLPATDWQGIDRAAIAAAIDEAFRDGRRAAGRNTRAVVILHRGRLVAERYAAGFDAGTPQLGWSMSKTVLGLLVYMKLQAQQQDASLRAVDWVTPQRRPPWLRDWERDQRSSIRLADLLFMRDGLDHQESYEPWGTVPRMLWGVDDVPAFAGSAPADAPAGQRFRYLSATTNILSRLLRAQFDSDAAYWRYPSQALFEPIGVRSAVLEATPAARSSRPPISGRRRGTGRASVRSCWRTGWPAAGASSRRDGSASPARRRPPTIRPRWATGRMSGCRAPPAARAAHRSTDSRRTPSCRPGTGDNWRRSFRRATRWSSGWA